MKTIVWYLGLGLVVLGAVLFLAPTFGFETVATERATDVGTAADAADATVGFEGTGEAIDGPADAATVLRVRNNADETLSVATSHDLSVADLVVESDGSGTLSVDETGAVTVTCGDYRGTEDATLTLTVDEAVGDSVRIAGARSTVSFLADCNVPALVWELASDWDAGSDDRTVHDDVGDRASDAVRLGYGVDESSLVGYWPLDEDSGSTALDASGHGNDGSHVNGPTVGAEGVLNSTSYEFEAASDQYVRVNDSASLRAGDSVSVSAWIYIDEKQTDGFTAIAQKSNHGYNLQLRNGHEPGFTIYDDTWRNAWSGAQLSAGEWHHLVGTYDGDTARIYVDGAEAGTYPGIGTMTSSDAPLGIGENLDETGRQFDGRIEELRIYDRGLSAAEVQDLRAVAEDGTHATGWKRAPVDLFVDRLRLENVTATLAGTNATVYVETDVDDDGTVDETSDPIHLADGVETYGVDGLANDTDRVRLRAELATDDVTRTPILERADVVEHYSNFSVAVDGTNEPVVEGEPLTVDVTVENVGSDPGDQTIELRDVDGAVVDTTEVSLEPGTSAQRTLTWATQVGDDGTGTVTVASDDGEATAGVTVRAQPNFDVAIDGTNSPAREGEALTVDATVQNTGDVAATQTLRLEDFAGQQVDATNVTLAGGETNDSITLAWQTQDGDAGSGTVTVRSDDDSETRDAWIDEVHYFDSCRDIGTDGTWVLTGDVTHSSGNCITLSTGRATIEGGNHTIDMAGTDGNAIHADRWGQASDYRIRNLTVDGGYRAIALLFVQDATVEDVSVTGAQTAFHVETQDGSMDAGGNVDLVDSAAYDVQNELLNVRGHHTDLDVRRLAAGDPAGSGSTLDFEVHPASDYEPTVLEPVSGPASPPAENVSLGDYLAIGTSNDPLENVTLHYDDADAVGVDESTAALWRYDADRSAWTRLDSTADPETDTVRVAAGLEAETDYGLFAADRPTFDVAIDDTSEPIDEGEDLTVDVTVENLDDDRDTQTVELRDFDGTVVDRTDVTLAGGETNSSIALTWPTRQGDNGTGTVTVASDTDADTRQVLIGDGSEYHVTIDAVHEPVTEGQPLDVDVTVENVADEDGSQTVALRDFDGDVVDSTEVHLGAGETNDSVTLTWATTEGDAGSGTLTVSSADDAATASATVQRPASLDVAIDGTNSPVGEGEALDVDVTVENTGDVEGSQTVTLESIHGAEVDARPVTLGAGDRRSITLTWDTQDGDAGTGDVTVASENDSATAAVEVEVVHLVSECTAIDQDGLWRLTGTVTHSSGSDCFPISTGEVTVDGQGNTIQMDGTSDTAFDAHRDGAPANYEFRNLTIDGGQRAFTTNFVDRVWIEDVTVRGPTLGIKSFSNDESADVTLVDTAFYDTGDAATEIQGADADLVAERFTIGDPAGNGATLSFTARPTSGDLRLAGLDSPSAAPTDNSSIDQYFEFVSAPDPLSNVVLHYDEADVQAVREETLALWRDDAPWTRLDSTVDRANRTVAVQPDLSTAAAFGAFGEDPPAFDVVVQSTTSPVAEGEALDVTVDVTNNGDAADTQTIELRDVDGAVVDTADVSVDAGTTETITLTWQTEGGDEGTGSVTVASPDDSEAREVTVEDGSQFDVTIDGANDPVLEGETLVVDANVTNHGTATDTESVALEAFDGTVVDSVDVTLAPGESDDSLALSWATEKGDYGTDDVNVTSEDDRASRTVTIDRQATFDVAITGANDPVREGETLVVDATVTNVGDVEGTQTVALEDFDGTVVDTTEVTLGSGETNDSLQFAWATEKGDNATDAVAVASDDATATRTVTVEGDPFFDVAIDGTNSPVEEGQDLLVDVNVTNTGDYADEQTVTLANPSGAVVDSTTVALGAGESNHSITLAWSTTEGDAVDGDVAVASENTTATAAVTVKKLVGPGDLYVENVSANVQPGDENQTIQYVIANEERDFHLEFAGAQGEGIDYEVNGEPTWTVDTEPTITNNDWVSQDWLTGIHLTLENTAPGDEIEIEITDYQTDGPAGPFTVQLKDNGDRGTVLAEDEFWIE